MFTQTWLENTFIFVFSAIMTFAIYLLSVNVVEVN